MAKAIGYTVFISAEWWGPSNECSGYMTLKPSDGEALEIRGMQNTPSLPLFPVLLIPGVDMELSMGQLELFDYLNWVQANDWCLIELLAIHGTI